MNSEEEPGENLSQVCGVVDSVGHKVAFLRAFWWKLSRGSQVGMG